MLWQLRTECSPEQKPEDIPINQTPFIGHQPQEYNIQLDRKVFY